jgi:hypothetical protein
VQFYAVKSGAPCIFRDPCNLGSLQRPQLVCRVRHDDAIGELQPA